MDGPTPGREDTSGSPIMKLTSQREHRQLQVQSMCNSERTVSTPGTERMEVSGNSAYCGYRLSGDQSGRTNSR